MRETNIQNVKNIIIEAALLPHPIVSPVSLNFSYDGFSSQENLIEFD